MEANKDSYQTFNNEYTETGVTQNENYQNITEEYPTSNYNFDNNFHLENSGEEYQQNSSYVNSGNTTDKMNENEALIGQNNNFDVNEIIGQQTSDTNNFISTGETVNLETFQEEKNISSNELISQLPKDYNNLEFNINNEQSLTELINAESTTNKIADEMTTNNIMSNDFISNKNIIDENSHTTNQYFETNLEGNTITTSESEINSFPTNILSGEKIENTKFETNDSQFNLNSVPLPSIDANQYLNNYDSSNQFSETVNNNTAIMEPSQEISNVNNTEFNTETQFTTEDFSKQITTEDTTSTQLNQLTQFETTETKIDNKFITNEDTSAQLYNFENNSTNINNTEIDSTNLYNNGDISSNQYAANEVISEKQYTSTTAEGFSENQYTTNDYLSTQLTTEGIVSNPLPTESNENNLFNKEEISQNLYTNSDSLENKFSFGETSTNIISNNAELNQFTKEETSTNLFTVGDTFSNTTDDINKYFQNTSSEQTVVTPVTSNDYNQAYETTMTTTTTQNFVEDKSTIQNTFQESNNTQVQTTDINIKSNLVNENQNVSSPEIYTVTKISSQIEPKIQPQPSVDLNNYDVNEYQSTQFNANTNSTKIDQYLPTSQPQPIVQNQVQNYNDDRISKLEGDTNCLKTQHQQIQDKLNVLSGEINSYKYQLGEFEKEREKNEINALRAENIAIKQQLSELNQLRNKAAEVNILKSQLEELETLRKKTAQMEELKKQLNGLDDLKAKVSELNQVKAQLEELKNLRIKINEMNNIEEQLGELNKLRIQVAEAENLKKKLNQMETDKINYEKEIENLRNNQKIESLKTENKENSKVNSQNIIIEEKSKNIRIKGDIIQNMNELEIITKKINKSNKKVILNLLYKASVDSDKASAFHEKCDEAKSSLVLIETDKGKRFGGFTNCSWKGDCINKKDEEAFVFSLDKMLTYDSIRGEEAIGCYPKFGPVFLGCQIRIFDNAFTKGGTTFEKGLNFNTGEDFELTGGDRVFKIKEIEVYEVVIQ